MQTLELLEGVQQPQRVSKEKSIQLIHARNQVLTAQGQKTDLKPHSSRSLPEELILYLTTDAEIQYEVPVDEIGWTNPT
jgi:hypothetical protein